MKKLKPILFSIAGTVLSAVAFFFFDKKKKTEQNPISTPQESSPLFSTPEASGLELYKTSGIKRLELKNIPESTPVHNTNVSFTGKAIVHPEEHDKYNVDIINTLGITIGNIEKNRRLSNSLSVWHDGQLFVFGTIQNPDNEDGLKGVVYLPVGVDEGQINDLQSAFNKLQKRQDILSKEEISSQEYLEILGDHKFISTMLYNLDISDVLDVSLSKRIIPILSKQLEEEENWEGLLQLSQHADLIDELNERFAGSTYRRISKARKMTGKKQ